ncbi:MAG: hypothetical protein ACE37I_13830 [Rubinisphaera brasiliensis]|uniref:Uncharacterized protein n=1 Tax=Rubinisphaera brasiliensis (strain ATCC 49424 / DSM 5305 / JCM 21570 / IAM 15109 / NBRC 103401 / IFAM 1448) TaxID=756272 RepID=F0SG68_RUBBR|nr:hypothetical protein [Rubinisphaera brasiliensis]ADY59410.1 hypothetical protein Plabr_1800 [Rubinisphaera brasiliensis DSM 5305]MBB03215.1 hypothetical protein [Planctomyces sp.]MBR9803430.1 hypothetical protein [bacterium]
MKRTFITLASVLFVVWAGSNLWLAGYQQGYEQGETTAWDRANTMRKLPLTAEDNMPASMRLMNFRDASVVADGEL